jgi:LCP family protein required for cell wall assembly
VPSPAGRRRAPRARHAARHGRLRRVLTVTATILVVLLATGTASAFVAYYKLNGNITRENLDPLIGPDRPKKVAENAAAENILLIGSDKRSGAAAVHTSGARSDTTILVHLAADRKSAVLVSIPRDSVVQVPPCTKEDGSTIPGRVDMFNSAYSLGGPACTIKTVEHLTNVRIDHHVVIDFGGFRNMVDALGGVEICVPYNVADSQSHLYISAGRHVVRGAQALAYVRTRHGIGNGSDLERIDRQQAFLSSMIKKATSTGLLLRPVKLYNFLSAATKSITTDPQLGSLRSMAELARSVQGIDPKNISFVTVPNEPYPADPNRVQFKEPAAGELWRAIRFDRPLPGHAPKTQQPHSSASPNGSPLRTPPENIHVSVLNGSGTPGAASDLAAKLEQDGFVVDSVGTATRQDYTTTTVLHDPVYNESGRTLGAAIPGSTVRSDASLSSTLVVIVGADGPTVVPVHVTGSTSTPAPEATIQARTANQNICN